MNWPTATLEECCCLLTDGTHYTPLPTEMGMPFLTVKDMSEDGLDLVGSSKISQFDFEKAKAGNSVPEPGDVLFSKDGTVGKVVVVGSEGGAFAVLSSIAIIRPKTQLLDAEFLGFILRSESVLGQALNKRTGSALRRIVLRDLRSVRVPLPPMDRQRHMVDMLSRAEGIVRLRREARAKAANIMPALFLDMFGDPATNPKGWATRRVDQLCSVQTGATPLRERRSYFEGGQVPWVKTGEVCGELIHSTEECITELAIQETNCKVFPVGTILVAMYGQGQTRGRVAMLGLPAATNQACAAILPGGAINQGFLFALLQMQYERLRAMGRGGNQENLNLGMIKALEVLTPPPELQGAFVGQANALRSIRSQQDSATNAAEAVFHALLARVFAGDTEVASVVQKEAAVA